MHLVMHYPRSKMRDIYGSCVRKGSVRGVVDPVFFRAALDMSNAGERVLFGFLLYMFG